MTTTIKAKSNGNTLDWPNLWKDLGMTKDKGGRFFPSEDTPEWVHDYCTQFRSPSRAWPYSYAKPLLTKKFAKLLCEKDPQLAIKLGVGDAE